MKQCQGLHDKAQKFPHSECYNAFLFQKMRTSAFQVLVIIDATTPWGASDALVTTDSFLMVPQHAKVKHAQLIFQSKFDGSDNY